MNLVPNILFGGMKKYTHKLFLYRLYTLSEKELGISSKISNTFS
jgi:hypothetical protein